MLRATFDRPVGSEVPLECLGQAIAVPLRQQTPIDLEPAIEALPDRLHTLRDRQIADAHLAQRSVHVDRKAVEHRLRQLLPGIAIAVQTVEQQDEMQEDHLQPSLDGIGNAEQPVEIRFPRLCNHRPVKFLGVTVLRLGPAHEPCKQTRPPF